MDFVFTAKANHAQTLSRFKHSQKGVKVFIGFHQFARSKRSFCSSSGRRGFGIRLNGRELMKPKSLLR